MTELNTFYLRPLTLVEAFDSWIRVAQSVTSGVTSAQFTTNIQSYQCTYNGPTKQISQHPEVLKFREQIANLDAPISCSRFTVTQDSSRSQPSIVVYSLDNSGIYAHIKFEHFTDPQAAVATIVRIKEHFRFVPRSVFASESLSKPEKEALAYHERTIAELQAELNKIATFSLQQIKAQDDFIKSITANLQEKFLKREEQLEQDQQRKLELLRQREEQLEEQHRARVATLEQREIDLQRKIADFDARENTVARRGLLKEIRYIIEDQAEFNLSKSTKRKRIITHAVIGASVLFL